MTETKKCAECGAVHDMTIDPATGKYRCEIRNYGPNGSPICFNCAMKTPESQLRVQKYMIMEMLGIPGTVEEIEARMTPAERASVNVPRNTMLN